jgi:phage FluMu protein Com
MYCGKCHNPVLVCGCGWLLANTDTVAIDCECPFCRRVYRFQVTLLQESEWSEEQAKGYVLAGKGR